MIYFIETKNSSDTIEAISDKAAIDLAEKKFGKGKLAIIYEQKLFGKQRIIKEYSPLKWKIHDKTRNI